MKKYLVRKFHESKRVPLWKWLLIIAIAVAMPLFFSFDNDVETQEALATEQQMAPLNSPQQ